MENTYEQESISLPAAGVLTEDPIIIKGGTHPPTPPDVPPPQDSIEIELGKLFNNGWTYCKNGDVITITINARTSNWVINPDPEDPCMAKIERPKSHFGNLKIKGYKPATPGDTSEQKPDNKAPHTGHLITINVTNV